MLQPPLRARSRKAWWRRISRPTYDMSPASWLTLLVLLFVVGCSSRDTPAVEESAAHAVEADSATTLPTERRLESGDQTVGQRLRDASLAAEVQLALVEERELRAFRFDPVVVDGQVLLQGHVESLDQRERAASVAASVPGVQDVINEVTSTEQPEAASP